MVALKASRPASSGGGVPAPGANGFSIGFIQVSYKVIIDITILL
jgi:hypothetical protein